MGEVGRDPDPPERPAGGAPDLVEATGEPPGADPAQEAPDQPDPAPDDPGWLPI